MKIYDVVEFDRQQLQGIGWHITSYNIPFQAQSFAITQEKTLQKTGGYTVWLSQLHTLSTSGTVWI